MHPKIKTRRAGEKNPANTVRPLMPHDAISRTVSARYRMVAIQPASGTANHARHHVSRRTQS